MATAVLFLKAAALPPGARWITVHPHGRENKGQHVLVEPTDDGGMKVIGGAGGALNHLKLKGVQSEDDYSRESAEREAAQREAKKRQRTRDREAGLTEAKSKAKEAIQAQVGDQRAKFIAAVSEAMGWGPEDLRFPHEQFQNLSPDAQRAAARKHANELLKKAKAAVESQRKRLIVDAEARSQAGMGEVPLSSSEPDTLSVQDLSPIEPTTKGFGFSADYKKRAEAHGATEEEIAAEAETIKPTKKRDDDGEPKGEGLGAKIAAEMKGVAEPTPKVKLSVVDARKAMDLLKAEKVLKGIEAQARAKRRDIEGAAVMPDPKAYLLEEGAPVDRDVVKDLESDLRTVRTVAFLDEVGKIAGTTESLGKYIGSGAFNSINGAALAVGGAALVDRSVVDVLGVAGAAQVLARRLHTDLTAEEMAQTAQAMQSFHVDHYMALSDKSLREAREWHEMAHEIEIGPGSSGAELTAAQELNAQRRTYVANAQRVLGTAVGEMEANAALVVAFQQKPKQKVEASLGKTSITSAIQQVRAIGLEKGDYQIEKIGPNTILTVNASGMDKLAQPVSREDLQATREAMDIIEGRQDEDGWLPKGVADRPDLAMNIKPGAAPRLAKPFSPPGKLSSPAKPESIDRDFLTSQSLTGRIDGDGNKEVDAKKMADLFHSKVSEAVARGDRVVLRINGKEQELSAKNGRAVMASDGAGVGVIGAMSDKNARLEIHPSKASPTAGGGAGIEQAGAAIEEYIGGRAADGDAPADIIKGLLSEDILQQAGDRDHFMAALNKIAPLYDANGQMTRVETYGEKFNALADSFVEKNYGADRTPFQRQQFALDDKSVDALHRALAEHPEGVAAFKPIGELTAKDQGALRGAFEQEHGKIDPKQAGLKEKLDTLSSQEPAKETAGLFGTEANPEWATWKADRDKAAEAVNAATMTWSKYVDTMGSPTNAYAAMQDVLKGQISRKFAETHNKLNPGKPLQIGRQNIAHDLNHLAALDPAARDKRQAENSKLVDSLRTRVAGRYAGGSVAEKKEAALAADAAADQAQMGLFGQTEAEQPGPGAIEKPLEAGQRFSLGHEAERQLAGMMPIVGKDFKPGQPIKIWRANMSGDYVGRQRAVKLIKHNKRMMLGLGTGSGKTSIMLSAFTDLKENGKAKRGLFLVPSVVQGQFHGEALTMLQPGKFNWHADPSASREQRIAHYKNPDTHFSVVTHQAFRDDLLHMAAAREVSTDGQPATPAAIADKLDAMSPADRKSYIAGVLKAEGIDHDYLAIDEGHNLLNRVGKENSRLANVVDSVSGSMPYYVNATADPVKNDASEAFDVLSKLRPDRYTDRSAFMRRYGVDTASARDALQREMARNFYTGRIDPGVKANKTVVPVEISDAAGQHDSIQALDDAANRAKLAGMRGDTDVEALRVLSPTSFEGVPEAQHAAVAKTLQDSIGILHNTAVQHAINDGAKTEALAKVAAARKGKPGVVFVHSLDRVKQIAERLEKDGNRVVTLTGGDSTSEKDRKKREYQAGKYDIIVMSDAGAVGANLQHGKWLAQVDTPQTAMVHAQRNGRIHRIGQTEDVELIDLVANHPSERRNRERLETKYGLRDVMTSPLEGLDDRGLAGYLKQARGETGPPPAAPAAPDDQASLF